MPGNNSDSANVDVILESGSDSGSGSKFRNPFDEVIEKYAVPVDSNVDVIVETNSSSFSDFDSDSGSSAKIGNLFSKAIEKSNSDSDDVDVIVESVVDCNPDFN